MDVHRVGSERTGQLTHALAGLGSDEPEQRCLRRGEIEVGEIGLPRPAACPVRHAEKETETPRCHVGASGEWNALPGSRWRPQGAHSTRLVAQASTATSGASGSGVAV